MLQFESYDLIMDCCFGISDVGLVSEPFWFCLEIQIWIWVTRFWLEGSGKFQCGLITKFGMWAVIATYVWIPWLGQALAEFPKLVNVELNNWTEPE